MKEILSNIQDSLNQLFIINKDFGMDGQSIYDGVDLELFIDRGSDTILVKQGDFSLIFHNTSLISISDVQNNSRIVLEIPNSNGAPDIIIKNYHIDNSAGVKDDKYSIFDV